MRKKVNVRLIAVLTCAFLIFSSIPSVFAQTSTADPSSPGDIWSGYAGVTDTTYKPSTPLVSQGVPQATIVTSTTPTTFEQKAAQELQTYVKKISGAELPIVTHKPQADIENATKTNVHTFHG